MVNEPITRIERYLQEILDNGGGGGGNNSYTLLATHDYNVSTTSTSLVEVDAWDCGQTLWQQDKIIYVRVRDKAGKRNGYFYGTDAIYFLTSAYDGGSLTSATPNTTICYKADENGVIKGVPNSCGIWGQTITNENVLSVKVKYNAVNGGTIDGTYTVDIYALNWPDGLSPFKA